MPDQNRPDFLRVTELTREELRKKRSPVASIAILIIVVVGASAGGYFLHQKFRANNTGAPLTANDLPADPVIADAPTAPVAPVAPVAPTSLSTRASTDALYSTSAPLAPPASFQPAPAAPAASAAPAAISAPSLSPDAPSVVPAPATTSAPSNATPIAADSAPALAPASGQSPAQLLTAADQMMAQRNYAQARKVLMQIGASNPAAHAAALYRLGLVGRYSGDEKLARSSWESAMSQYPADPAGRLSALGLADLLYHQDVEQTQDFSQWEKIRDAYALVIGTDGARFLDDATDRRVGERLNKLTAKLIFDPSMKVKGADFHTVKSGEYPATIAREYGIDFSSIVTLNNIDPNRLRAGQELKIVAGKLLLVVDKKRFTADFFLDGRFIKRYPCATGAPATETPAGRYTIVDLVKEPSWTAPDGRVYKYGEPGHLIGPRWMAMRGMNTKGLGVHGTVDPSSMGKKISNGCVRLLNNDVIELYGFASKQPGREAEVLVLE